MCLTIHVKKKCEMYYFVCLFLGRTSQFYMNPTVGAFIDYYYLSIRVYFNMCFGNKDELKCHNGNSVPQAFLLLNLFYCRIPVESCYRLISSITRCLEGKR